MLKKFRNYLFFLIFIIILIIITSCSLFVLPTSPVNYKSISQFYFNTNSLWNNKLSTNVELETDSKKYIEYLSTTIKDSEPYVLIDEGAVAVYYTDSNTSRYNIRVENSSVLKNGIKNVPIPEYALPDRATDAHTVFIDQEYNLLFEFWQFKKLNGRWVAGNSAIFDVNGLGFSPYISARASGFSLLGGLIWPEELLSTNIQHPLLFAVKYITAENPVLPANHTDGRSYDKYSLPMGSRIQLDPSFDINSITNIDKYQKAILKALQEYGAFLGDTGNFSFCAVNPVSFNENPYKIIPSYSEENGSIDLSCLPVDKLRVIKFGEKVSNVDGVNYESLYY